MKTSCKTKYPGRSPRFMAQLTQRCRWWNFYWLSSDHGRMEFYRTNPRASQWNFGTDTCRWIIYLSITIGRQSTLPFIRNKKICQVEYVIPNWSQEAYKFNTNSESASFEDSVKLTEEILEYLNIFKRVVCQQVCSAGALKRVGVTPLK